MRIDSFLVVVETDIEKQISVLVKEELDKQLGEIREQLSSLSSKVDEIEREQGNKWNFLQKFRKHTLDEKMAEYNKIKEEMHKPKEENTDI